MFFATLPTQALNLSKQSIFFPGTSRSQKLLIVEGDHFGASEQPGLPLEEGLVPLGQGQVGDLWGIGANLLRGEQRVSAEGVASQGGDRPIRGHRWRKRSPSAKSAPKALRKLKGEFLNMIVLGPLRGRTHIRIKGQNLNFYLETHATPQNIHTTPHIIYFIRLRILPKILGTLLACGWPLKEGPFRNIPTVNIQYSMQ